ncbi:hypothetical protein J4E86_011184 [Alternaria arbusti]|uniref:uncharacterized protein n=1 Tax=Alternaria arbusti TaxID=232088 RepID=UPI00222050C7|nr:uncharacterized protein J4E86_011184 [Alternaria arbusti]KAI4940218.1 hypothetical protein J4E86_011184 [Alternaria arbusti]
MRFNTAAGLALSLAIPTGALSVPRDAAPEPAGKIVAKLFCDVVGGLVTVAKQQPQATSFCSSYLKIPVVKKTSTVTSFTATTTTTTLSLPTTITTSVTVPLTIFETATATDIVTATDTITNTATETSTITEQTTVFTATSAVIAIPTFTVYAIGGPNNGNPMSNANGNIVRNTRGTSPPPVLQFTTVDINKLQVLNGPYAGSIGKTDPNASGSGAALYFGSYVQERWDLSVVVPGCQRLDEF